MIITDRLEIFPASVQQVRDALAGAKSLAAGIGADVPATWPPPIRAARWTNFRRIDMKSLRLGLAIALLSAGGGNAFAGDSFHLDQSAAIVIAETGVDGPGSRACKKFRLREADVRAFFATAEAVTAEEARKNYRRAPCFVRGAAKVGADTYTWEIRAYGTATVTLPNGAKMQLGDPERRHPDK
jgi:hypothetical protein